MTTPRRRILFVEQNQDGTVGGSHHALLMLVRYLDRTEFEPTVAFYESHALLDEFRQCARVVVLPAPRPVRVAWANRTSPIGLAALMVQKAVNFTRSSLASAARMIQVAVRLRPHIIHMNNSVLSGVEWLVTARLCGAKCLSHQRGYAPPESYARHFERIICVSNDVRTRLLADMPSLAGRTLHIYDAIDIEVYRRRAALADTAAIRREMGASSADALIGVVGNVKEWKGQETLIRALPLLEPSLSWRCLVVGSVSASPDSVAYLQRLRDLAQQFGVADRVVFTGYRSDVPAIVSALDVLVHTSIDPEPLGLVVFEGMALAKPVIGTAHGGPAETIEDQRSGFLVPPRDAGALAARINELLKSAELRARVGRAGFERVTTQYSPELHVSRVQDVYRSLGLPASAASGAKRVQAEAPRR